MKVTFGIIIALLLVTALGALDTDYDISNFKPTDLLEYDLAPSISNTSWFQHYAKDDDFTWYINDADLIGTFIKEKPAYYMSFNTIDGLHVSTSRDGSPGNPKPLKQGNWSPTYSFYNTGEYKRYFDQSFIGTEFTSYYQIRRGISGNNNDSNVLKSNSKEIVTADQFAFSAGYGRLYQCQEAYLAWRIFEEMDKSGCLNREINDTDINDLALTLYKIRSVHDLDYRIFNRKQISMLLEYLKWQGYLNDSSDTAALAILIEMWNDRDDEQRLTGTRVQIKPFGSKVYYKSSSHTDYATDPDHFGYEEFDFNKAGLDLSLNYENPLTNDLQLSSKVSFQQGWYNDRYAAHESDTVKEDWKPFTHIAAGGSLTYYPDIRSSIAFEANSSLALKAVFDDIPTKYSYYVFGDDILDLNNIDRNLETFLTVYATYQLSYRLKIVGQVQGTYNYMQDIADHVTQEKRIITSLGLSYRLF